MKTKKYTFLLTVFFFINLLVNSQEKIDSLTYYINQVGSGVEFSTLAKAYPFINLAKERSLEDGNKQMAAYYLEYMSFIEYELGLLYNSEKTAVDALDLLDELPKEKYNNDLRYRLFHRIGLIQWEYKDYRKSLYSFSRLLKYAENDTIAGIVYNNLGVTHRHLKQYDSAQFYLEKAYAINKRINNKIEEARSLDNLGFVQGMKDSDKGERNMMEALRIRDSIGKDSYTSYKHLTEFHRLKNNKSRALFYAEKAYDVAIRDKSDSYRLDALRNLLELGQVGYSAEYLELSDKVSSEIQSNENKFAKAKYDYKKEQLKATQAESEATKKQLQIEKERFKMVLYQGLTGFVILVLISAIVILRTRHRKNILVKQFETEQRISKKLHDEVANDVFHTITRMRRDKSVSEEFLDPLDEVYHKVRDISKSNADLDVTLDFGRLLQDLIVSYKSENVNIFTKDLSKINWQEVSKTKKKVVYRVIQELMVNMQKHSQASLVTLSFEKFRKKIGIEYIDNGVGGAFEKGTGLRNTESRMELVGGKISFKSETGKGFRANLIL